MLSVSCARAFACSLVRSRSEVPDSLAGCAPDLAMCCFLYSHSLTD